ncbi:UDP-glucose--sterol glucosyltransferase [Streptomyces sp. WAC 01529]|nr:UDP-glucose--sterol glucosyltransferase [Streptomyces sp. WAC 01529]
MRAFWSVVRSAPLCILGRMRILLVTWGSTGDVLPYAGLGARLKAAGHEVTAATSERHAARFQAGGMPVHILPLARHEESALSAERFDRWQSPARLRRRKRNAQEMTQVIARGVLEAVTNGAEIILAHPMTHPLCAVIAEGTGRTCIGIYAASPGMLVPQAGANTATGRGYRAAERLVWAATHPLYAPALSWLQRELGARSRRFRTPSGILRGARVLHGFSPALLPKRLVLPQGHKCAGYWWPTTDSTWRPDDRLADFLASGPAPVFFGFGSLSIGGAEPLSDMIKSVVRRLGVRAVVQAGWQGLDVHGDGILTIGECPHDWLFPRMSALVHHAGSGTVGAGLRAGVPAVPVPLVLDQPFWARRLTALGLSPGYVSARRLTADSLSATLRTALQDKRYRERCAKISRTIESEDGTIAVLDELEGHLASR